MKKLKNWFKCLVLVGALLCTGVGMSACSFGFGNQTQSYKITYYANDGTESYRTETCYDYQKDAFTIGVGMGFDRPWYRFVEWNTAADGTGTAYESCAEYQITGDLNLYAIWEDATRQITYHANDGTEQTTIQTFDSSRYVNLKANNAFTRTGYEITKWNTTADGSGTVYYPGNSDKLTDNLDLYAVWQLKNYSLSYNYYTDNGSSLSGVTKANNPSSYNVETPTITLQAPSKTGYTFEGWYREREFINPVTEITQGSTGDIRLYAKFSLIPYTITYELDGGTNGDNPSTYNVTTSTFTLQAPTKDGYTFDGWYRESEFINRVTRITQGTTGEITLYAKFTLTNYSITYVLNGGVNGNNPSAYTIETDSFALSMPTKNGYHFDGWYSESNFVNQVTEITKGTMGNITLYAKFESISYTITYELDGGVNGNNRSVYTCTNSFILQDPSKNGYYFGGWYSDSNYANKVTQIKYGTTGDITLYARWCTNEDIYNVDNDTIIGLNDIGKTLSLKILDIPSQIKGVNITAIGLEAFRNNKTLTKVVIPAGITDIGNDAFYNCSMLNEVHITDLSAWIQIDFGNKFANPLCSNDNEVNLYLNGEMVTDLVIPDGVIHIGSYVFYGRKDITSITIPDCVTSIGNYAFDGCSGLTSVIIGSGVTSLNGFSFSGNTNLTTVVIGNNVTSISNGAFSGCSSLQNITLPFVGDSANATDAASLFGYIFGTSKYIGGTSTRQCYTSSDAVYYIPTTLTTVTITGGRISYGAFYNCSDLTSITIGNGVTSIGISAFKNCRNLTNITIPDSVTSIGCAAFSGCSSLQNITLPFVGYERDATDTSSRFGYIFGYSSFNGGIKIEQGHSSSAATYYIPATLTTVTITGDNIPSDAFCSCFGLTSITISNGVTSIGDKAFEYCSKLTSITIGNSVTSIGKYAFYYCSSLANITIPDSVTSIGNSAFDGCSGLTSVIIGNGVTSLNGFFGGKANLTTVVIGNGVTSIDSCAFVNCNGLTSITIPDSVTSIGVSAFSGCIGLTSIIIPDSVTSIDNYAFEGCSGLTSITIGNSVTSIGKYAFYYCSSLANITIPDSVTSIGDEAFEYCSKLTSITIGNSVTSIGVSAFSGCIGLTSVIIPDSVTSIGNSAFYGCSNLTSITIGNSVTSIGGSAFRGCIGLTSIIIPDSVTSIGGSAFEDCSGLTSVIIPDSVTSIGNYAFEGCSGLESVTFADTDGWYISNTSGATSGINLTLTDAAANVRYLTSYYENYYWYKG